MKANEFILKYANVPVSERKKKITGQNISLDDIFRMIKKSEEIMKPAKIKQEEYLRIAEIYFFEKERN